MSINIRLPNITATSDSGKLQQMQSYMHQLVEQLNWALNTVESAQGGNTSAVVYQQKEPATAQEAEDTFNSIKALIIKSADIVKAYETTIFSDFNGKYFAESDFGTYIAETNRQVKENSDGVLESYSRIETITNTDGTGRLDWVEEEVRTTNGYIQRGILPDGSIGIEVGETNDNGYHRYAQFTAERLTFYDVNGNPVAYIGAGDADKSDANCLYVTGKAVFLGEIQLGHYKTDSSDGLAFTWIGG
jgi:hypothetical protein